MSKKCSFCYYIRIYHKNENNVALGLGKPQYHRLELNVCKKKKKNNVKHHNPKHATLQTLCLHSIV